nr:hypothetical protein [Tanacetum cinerariifolium]
MEDLIEVSDAKITIRSSLGFLRDVKKKLKELGNEKRNTLFRATVFSKWLDISAFANDNLLLNYIFHHQSEKDSKKYKEKVAEPPKKKKKAAKSSKKKNKADEESPKKMTTYNLYGFMWSLKIYILEIFPNSKYWWKKDPDVIPRGISWSIIENFRKRNCSRLYAQWSSPILTFVPSDNEFVQSWCIDSFQYFTNSHESFQTDSVEVLVPDVEQEHNLICLISDTADETSQLDLNIHSDDHVQDLNSAYQDMDKDSNIHCKDHVEEQNSSFQDMDKESNIHSHDNVEQQNSPNMCKDYVVAEFDAIKAIVDIIDKTKGQVSTSCLEKELDIVKDRIAMLEKCFKLRYHNTSEDSVKQVCYKPHDFHCSKV